VASPQVRALCCECGTLRMTGLNSAIGEGWRDELDRCLVRRKCKTCGIQTSHAYLRDGDRYADHCEETDTGRSLERELLWLNVDEEIEQLRDCEVLVIRDDGTMCGEDEAARVVQYLDDGRFALWINPTLHPDTVLALLDCVWGLVVRGIPDKHWRVYSAKPGEDDPIPLRVTTLMRPGR
jgi:hypothetical protein